LAGAGSVHLRLTPNSNHPDPACPGVVPPLPGCENIRREPSYTLPPSVQRRVAREETTGARGSTPFTSAWRFHYLGRLPFGLPSLWPARSPPITPRLRNLASLRTLAPLRSGSAFDLIPISDWCSLGRVCFGLTQGARPRERASGFAPTFRAASVAFLRLGGRDRGRPDIRRLPRLPPARPYSLRQRTLR
jgi:hypothetical protein